VNNIDTLKNANGIEKVVKRLRNAKNLGSYKGAAWELEYAASKSLDDIIEICIDVCVEGPDDIDLLVREGNDIVGCELKNIDYATWTKYQSELGDLKKGFEKLQSQGIIYRYKIVFKGSPPAEMVNWLNSHNIQWEYVV
jgi:hypothetical protein